MFRGCGSTETGDLKLRVQELAAVECDSTPATAALVELVTSFIKALSVFYTRHQPVNLF